MNTYYIQFDATTNSCPILAKKDSGISANTPKDAAEIYTGKKVKRCNYKDANFDIVVRCRESNISHTYLILEHQRTRRVSRLVTNAK